MSEISDFISNNIKFSDNIKKYLEITYSIKDGLYDSINVGALDNKQFEHVKINNVLFFTFDPYFTIHYFFIVLLLFSLLLTSFLVFFTSFFSSTLLPPTIIII